MVKPYKSKIEKLKKQDKELTALEKEKKKIKQGETYLQRLMRPEPIEADAKKLLNPSRKKR